MPTQDRLSQVLTALLHLVTLYPSQTDVHIVTGRNTFLCEITCASEDIGRIVGQHGQTITAITTLLHATNVRQTLAASHGEPYRSRIIVEPFAAP